MEKCPILGGYLIVYWRERWRGVFLFVNRRLCGVEYYPSFASLHTSNHAISPFAYLRNLLKRGLVYLLYLKIQRTESVLAADSNCLKSRRNPYFAKCWWRAFPHCRYSFRSNQRGGNTKFVLNVGCIHADMMTFSSYTYLSALDRCCAT